MNTYELIQSSIKLLNVAPKFAELKHDLHTKYYKKALNKGIIIDPSILMQLAKFDQEELINNLINKFGIDSKEMNSTFIKTFEKAEQMPSYEMLAHQLLHYASSYGDIDFLKNDSVIYLPNIEYDAEPIKNYIETQFKIIRFANDDEFTNAFNQFLTSNMPMSSNDVNMVQEMYFIIKDQFKLVLPDVVGNRELKINLLLRQTMDSNFKIVPKNSNDFIRLIIKYLTNLPLVIKDRHTINSIKMQMQVTYLNKNKNVLKMLKSYEEQFGLIELAKSFNRYKPFYLALKTNDAQINKIINKISKLSKKHHEAMQIDILGNAIQYIIQSNDKNQAMDDIKSKIDKAEIYQLIKLLNIIELKIQSSKLEADEYAKIFKIRNGRTYVTSKKKSIIDVNYLLELKEYIISNLKSQMSHLQEKVYYIPDNIEYAMPTSTKSFIGETIPDMTKVKVKGNFSVGIHWNVDADIDLSGHNFKTNEYVSWHSGHKSQSLIYSGDMTGLDSTGNAHESIFVKDTVKDPIVFSQSLYHCFNGSNNVNSKFIICDGINPSNYQDANNAKIVLPYVATYDANNFAISIPLENDETEIVMTSVSNAGRHVADTDLNELAYDAVKFKIDNSLSLKAFLKMIDVTILTEEELKNYDGDKELVDFSINKVSKDKFINLLSKEVN